MKDGLEDFAVEHKEELARLSMQYTPQLLEILQKHGIQAMMDSVYHFIDEAQESSGLNQRTTCSAGCSFCCYTDVQLTEFEASYIKSYVEQCKIPYSKTRVTRQTSTTWDKVKYRDKRCPMLDKEGHCNIYGVRPMICRVYNSIDKPSKCNTQLLKYPNHGMLRIVPVYAMMLAVMNISNEKITISQTLKQDFDGKEKLKNS